MNEQYGLFDYQDRMELLAAKGDPLVRLNDSIPGKNSGIFQKKAQLLMRVLLKFPDKEIQKKKINKSRMEKNLNTGKIKI